MDQRNVLILVCFGLFGFFNTREADTAVVHETQVSSCNSPCGLLDLTCPRDTRMAIREVLFSVAARTTASSGSSQPCSVVKTCGTQTQCCDQSSVQDCVFSYSPSHLEAVHRNCSGTRACVVKTERTQEESVACPFFRPEDTVSHTIMDYVCINENAIVDICTLRETRLEGRTLFTMLDTGRWRNPRGGAVCRCTAESVKWPTTNTIAVFVVDMRLNMLREAHCSKADVTLKSGSVTRHLDCESSRDPRQASPFLALLNHSNVATVELVLHKKLPEIVWIGFESNEMEDIRLTCALQGYVPILPDDTDLQNASAAKAQEQIEEDGSGDGVDLGVDMAAIVGSVAGTLALCVILLILVLVIVFYRKRQRQKQPDEYSEPQDAVDDIDVYYSTPDLTAPRTAIHSVSAEPAAASGAGADDEDEGEMYITAAAVRERKRTLTKKVVRILSIPEISNDVAEYYASPWDIRDRRRLEEGRAGVGSGPGLGLPAATKTAAAGGEKKKRRGNNISRGGAGDGLKDPLSSSSHPSYSSSERPPDLLPPAVCSEDGGDEEDEDYAVLDHHQPGRWQDLTSSSADLDNYDHLPSWAAGAPPTTTTTTTTPNSYAPESSATKPGGSSSMNSPSNPTENPGHVAEEEELKKPGVYHELELIADPAKGPQTRRLQTGEEEEEAIPPPLPPPPPEVSIEAAGGRRGDGLGRSSAPSYGRKNGAAASATKASLGGRVGNCGRDIGDDDGDDDGDDGGDDGGEDARPDPDGCYHNPVFEGDETAAAAD